MQSIGIRELKAQASAIIRRVHEHGEEFVVTSHGRPVARLVPVAPERPSRSEIAAYLTRLDRVAAENSRRWPAGVTAAQAVSEDRRELS